MAQHIGKLIVAGRKFIPIIYEFEESYLSITNIEPLGYQVLDSLENSGSVGVLELGTRRRVAFKIIKRMGDIIHKKILCAAEVLPDEYIAHGLRLSPTPLQDDISPGNGVE